MMAADYPNAIKTFTVKQDGVDDVMADHVNALQDEITAIETELGTNPKGDKADVKTRLDDIENSIDDLAGANRTIETVKGNADALVAHSANAVLDHPDGSVTDTKIGNRTADQTQAPTGSTGTLTQLLSWVVNRIKTITGKTNWYDTPDITLATLVQHKSRHASGGTDALTPADIGAETPAGAQAKVDEHANSTSAHSATSAATASRIMMRDAYGRAKVAAPAAGDDIARKAEVDTVQSNLTSHTGNTNNPHTVTKAQVGLGNVVDKEQVNAIAVGSTSDPNTTQEPYILTNHPNSPGGRAGRQCGVYWHIHTYFYSNKTGNRAQIAILYNGIGDDMYIRHYYDGSWTAWTKVWHAGNDGPGSGLDADTVDNIHFRNNNGTLEWSPDGTNWYQC